MLWDDLHMLMFNIILYSSLTPIVMKFLTVVTWGRHKTTYLDWFSFLGEHQLWANSYSRR